MFLGASSVSYEVSASSLSGEILVDFTSMSRRGGIQSFISSAQYLQLNIFSSYDRQAVDKNQLFRVPTKFEIFGNSPDSLIVLTVLQS